MKNDLKDMTAAGELRERYLEEVNSGGGSFPPGAQGKSDFRRPRLVQAEPRSIHPVRFLEAACWAPARLETPGEKAYPFRAAVHGGRRQDPQSRFSAIGDPLPVEHWC